MSEERPIIIIKKKSGHGGHHGGAWKVAYADFVTAMMALFLVLWILGLNQNVRQSIAAYFNNPTGVMKTTIGGASKIGIGVEESGTHPSIIPTQPSKSDIDTQNLRFKQAKEKLEKIINNSSEFKKLSKNISITITSEGLRIELLENQQALFFKRGSAVLEPSTAHLLVKIASVLRQMPNKIMIDGYTDAKPYAGGLAGYSNWELSSDRANSARRAMANTLKSNQVEEIRGYGPTHLRDPAHPFAYVNRRVSILVTYNHSVQAAPIVNVGSSHMPLSFPDQASDNQNN
jgi:chemotaxis protein MotB